MSSPPEMEVRSSPAGRRPRTHRLPRLRTSDVIGAVVILVGLLVPSATWPDVVRTSPVPPEASLELGGMFFGAGLIVLGMFALSGILAIGAFLRLYALDSGLWLDEILTLVYYARLSAGDIVTSFSDQNQHLLYTLSAHASFLIFGESDWALRLPAVILGMSSLLALYLFSRRVTTEKEALIATLVLTLSYHHIWFSQNARGYTGLLFWTLLSSWLFLRALTDDRRRLWLYYAVSVALGMFTHQTMVFVVISQFLILVGIVAQRSRQRQSYSLVPIGAGFVTAALLTFQLHALVLPQILGPMASEATTVGAWNSPWWALMEMVRGLRLDALTWLGVPMVVAVVGVGSLSYSSRNFVVPVLLFLPATLLSAAVILLGHPLWPRFFVFLAGFAVLIVIRGIRVVAENLGALLGWNRTLSVRLRAAVAVVAVVVLAGSAFSAYGPKQDFLGAKQLVTEAQQPGESVVSVGLARVPYALHYAPEWQVAETPDEIRSILDASSRVWLIYTFAVHMASDYPEILALVEEEFEPMGRFDGTLAGGSVFVYRSYGGVTSSED